MKTFNLFLFLLISSCLFNGCKSSKSTKSTSVGSLPNDISLTHFANVNQYGKSISSSDINNAGKPFLIVFSATWCPPCTKELNAINDVYEQLQSEGVKVFLVFIDDNRSSTDVVPFVKNKGYDFEVLIDSQGNFKRAMGVGPIPQTFLLNGKRKIVWTQTAFSEGKELEIVEMVKKLNRGEKIK